MNWIPTFHPWIAVVLMDVLRVKINIQDPNGRILTYLGFIWISEKSFKNFLIIQFLDTKKYKSENKSQWKNILKVRNPTSH